MVTLKRQLAVEFLPRGRNLSPKRNHTVTLKSQETGGQEVLEKKRNLSSREDSLSSGPEEAATARAAAPRRQCSEGHLGKTRMDISLVGRKFQTQPPPIL